MPAVHGLTASPDPLDGWSLPEWWTSAARDLFAEVLQERPEIAGADLGALESACGLVSNADRLGEIARGAGMIAQGSTGQTVVHPAVIEERLTRASAATILARLAPARAARFADRALTAARARHSRGTQ